MSPAPDDAAFRLHVLIDALTKKGLSVARSAEPASRSPLEDPLPIQEIARPSSPTPGGPASSSAGPDRVSQP